MKVRIQCKVFVVICVTFLFVFRLCATWAEETLAQMSLHEKIGQLFVVAAASCFEQQDEALASAMMRSPYDMSPEHVEHLIKEYHVGGLLFLYKSTPEKQIEYINRYYRLSKYPLWTLQDCEWGLSMRLDETVRFPRNMTLGAIQDSQLLYEMGREIGCQCKLVGVDMNLAPVVDVNNNAANPVISDRSFGDDKEQVTKKAICLMQGMRDAGILTCAKHFPGHGDTEIDSHFVLPIIPHDRARLDDIELYPFKKMIAAGCDAIMNAHLHVPAYDARDGAVSSLSRAIVTDLLQNELGFDGLIMTDAMGMQSVVCGQPGQAEFEAFMAGNDIVLAPLDVPAAASKLERAVSDGTVSMAELDRRVLKILRAKERVGAHLRSQIPSEGVCELNTAHAYALKKSLYQEAITLVRGSLPVAPSDRLCLVQIGGQQDSMFAKTFCAACSCSSVYLQSNAPDLSYEKSAKQLAAADTVVVGIFGVHKFAHKQYGISDNTLRLVRMLKERGKKVVVVIFGNAYSLKLFPDANVVLMAYEDDQDAQEAAAHVLLEQGEAKGKLPIKLS